MDFYFINKFLDRMRVIHAHIMRWDIIPRFSSG